MAGLSFQQIERNSPVNTWKKRLALRLNMRALTTGVLLAAFFVAILALVQFATPDLASPDDYYHIKLAQLMRTEGLKPAFPWLPLTILNAQEFYDHHFLFHVG